MLASTVPPWAWQSAAELDDVQPLPLHEFCPLQELSAPLQLPCPLQELMPAQWTEFEDIAPAGADDAVVLAQPKRLATAEAMSAPLVIEAI